MERFYSFLTLDIYDVLLNKGVLTPPYPWDCFVWTPSESEDLEAFELALSEVDAIELGSGNINYAISFYSLS